MPVTEEDFQAGGAWGISTTIDLKNCDPDLVRSVIDYLFIFEAGAEPSCRPP